MTTVSSSFAICQPVSCELLSKAMVTSTAYVVTVGIEESVGVAEGEPDGASDGDLEVVGAGVMGFPATKT